MVSKTNKTSKSKRLLSLLLSTILIFSAICIPMTANAAGKAGGVYGYLVSPVNVKDSNKTFRNRCVSPNNVSYLTLKLKIGTKLYAMEGGVVSCTGQTSASGKYIIIRSTWDGMSYYIKYYHLGTIGVKKGTKIGRGAYIGLSGNTGGNGTAALSLAMGYKNWNSENRMQISKYVGYSLSNGSRNFYPGTIGTQQAAAIKVNITEVKRDKVKNTLTVTFEGNSKCFRYVPEISTSSGMKMNHSSTYVYGVPTDAKGTFTFKNVPDSKMYVRVWGEITKNVNTSCGPKPVVTAINYGDLKSID